MYNCLRLSKQAESTIFNCDRKFISELGKIKRKKILESFEVGKRDEKEGRKIGSDCPQV